MSSNMLVLRVTFKYVSDIALFLNHYYHLIVRVDMNKNRLVLNVKPVLVSFMIDKCSLKS